MLDPHDLEIFFGQSTTAEARIYVQYVGPDAERLKISGHIHGPFSDLARTLAPNIVLRDRGPGSGKTLVAEATIPDPCFWVPGEPYYYRAQVSLVDRKNPVQPLETVERMFGIRPLAAHGRDLFLAARRFVVRGVRAFEPLSASELAECRELGTALVLDQPDADSCHLASRAGVLLVAQVQDPAELFSLAMWPAVAMALLPADTVITGTMRRPKNLLLGQHFSPGTNPALADWADVAVVEDQDAARLFARAEQWAKPVLAFRPAAVEGELSLARRACDFLQRDLAPWGDFAGYLV